MILVGSCVMHMSRGYHDAIRATWGKDSAIPYFFVVGSSIDQGTRPMFMNPDTIVVPCPDGREDLALKALLGQKWARRQGFDFVFQAWNDTYCFTKRMLASGFERSL